MPRTILGIVMFVAPVVGLVVWLFISGGVTHKAYGLGYLRGFALSFFTAAVLFLVAGIGLLYLPR